MKGLAPHHLEKRGHPLQGLQEFQRYLQSGHAHVRNQIQLAREIQKSVQQNEGLKSRPQTRWTQRGHCQMSEY